MLMMAEPEQGPSFLVQFCQLLDLSSDCFTQYSPHDIGAIVTQVIANADVGGLDGQVGQLNSSSYLH